MKTRPGAGPNPKPLIDVEFFPTTMFVINGAFEVPEMMLPILLESDKALAKPLAFVS
jgi:hypothetical protein